MVSRREVAIVAVCALLLGVVHVLVLREWNPLFSDTRYHYLPTLEILDTPNPSFVSLYVAPFFRMDKDISEPRRHANQPLAQDAKPVFVCALRMWHSAYRWLSPCQPGLDRPHAFSDFVTFCCVLAFCALCLLARKLGSLPIGIVAGFMTFLSPWGLWTCSFATYTALSLAMIFLMMYLGLLERRACTYLSGILLALCAMTNQSLLACLVAQPLLLAMAHWKSGAYKLVVRMGVFFVGVATPFLATEMLATSRVVQDQVGLPHLQTPLTILTLYGIRNTTDAREFINSREILDVYDYSRFLSLLTFNSTVSVIFLAVVLLIVLAIFALADGNRIHRFSRWIRSELMFPANITAMLAVITLASLELRNGPRMSRSYFVAVPFLFLSMLFLVRYWTTIAPRRLSRIVLAVFALAWCAENVVRVADYYQTFHAARLALREFQQRGDRLVCLRSDSYNCFLRNLADLEVVDDEASTIPDDVRYIVTGPAVASACEGTQRHVDSYASMRQKHVKLVPKKAVPFFALYPYLTYEDPFATYQLLVKHTFRTNSYKTFSGSVRIWEVVAQDELPGLAELGRFPRRTVANLQLGTIIGMRDQLQKAPPSRERKQALIENARQLAAWKLLLEARGGLQVEEGRSENEVTCRRAFRSLRDLLGEKDWRDGRMPRVTPLQSFEAAKLADDAPLGQ